MRDSNFIKKDEKCIPHFRRPELFPSGGGKPEWEGGGAILPCQGRAHYFTFEYDETRRRGLDLTPMSEDGSLFQTRERKARMGLPEFTPVKNYKFLPGDPEMYNGDPVAKSLIL